MAFTMTVTGVEDAQAVIGVKVAAELAPRVQRAYGRAVRSLVRDATRAIVAAYPRVTGRLRRSLAVVARRVSIREFSAVFTVRLIVANPGAVYHGRVLARPQHRHLDGFVNRFVDQRLAGYVRRALLAEFRA